MAVMTGFCGGLSQAQVCGHHCGGSITLLCSNAYLAPGPDSAMKAGVKISLATILIATASGAGEHVVRMINGEIMMNRVETCRLWQWLMASLRRWQFATVILLVVSAPLYASEFASGLDNEEVQLSIATAVAEVVEANPGLAALGARAEALAALPDQLGALPDPWLSLKLMNLPVDSFSFAQEGMTQTQVGINQMLPFPGKLGLRQEVAEALANAAGFGVDELRLRLVRDVKIVWWNLFFLDRSLEVVNNNQMLMRQLIEV
ncbi:MAG TPA: hypothetical protein ENJ65_06560, partial [Candidatus Tenderia electrophaga]|nr:hypothetical protein [Candidatus Tenderia electrophaga]